MDPHGSSVAQSEGMKVYLYMTAGSRYHLRTCHSGTVIRATVFDIMGNMELISWCTLLRVETLMPTTLSRLYSAAARRIFPELDVHPVSTQQRSNKNVVRSVT